ncbi:helix-turn-helix transcriptional regulator [Nocardioides sp. BGMRC 2183]|nr:helix-turn-helix transcriptional regulator [Nocardioides sp. BGMRC 2183]
MGDCRSLPADAGTVAAHPTSPRYPDRAQAFSDRLKWLRNERGLSQTQVAELATISRTRYQQLEWNRKGPRDPDGPANPTLDVLWQLADALDVTIGDLLDPTSD